MTCVALTAGAISAIAEIDESGAKGVSKQERLDIERAFKYGAAHKKEGGQFVEMGKKHKRRRIGLLPEDDDEDL